MVCPWADAGDVHDGVSSSRAFCLPESSGNPVDVSEILQYTWDHAVLPPMFVNTVRDTKGHRGSCHFCVRRSTSRVKAQLVSDAKC